MIVRDMMIRGAEPREITTLAQRKRFTPELRNPSQIEDAGTGLIVVTWVYPESNGGELDLNRQLLRPHAYSGESGTEFASGKKSRSRSSGRTVESIQRELLSLGATPAQ